MRVEIVRPQFNKIDHHFFLSPRDRSRNGGGFGWGGVLTVIPKTQPFSFFNTTSKLFKKYFKASKFVSFA